MRSKIRVLSPVRKDVINVNIPIILEKYPDPDPVSQDADNQQNGNSVDSGSQDADNQ